MFQLPDFMTKDIPGGWTYSEDDGGFNLKNRPSLGDTLKLLGVFLVCSPFIGAIGLFIWNTCRGWSEEGLPNWNIALLVSLLFIVMVTFALRAALHHYSLRGLRFTTESGLLEFRLAYFFKKKISPSQLTGIKLHTMRGQGGLHGSDRYLAYLYLNRTKKRPIKIYLFSCDDLSSEIKPIWDSLIDRLHAHLAGE